jgi:hypothetical protein
MRARNLQFDQGLLVPGTHILSRDEFLKMFCSDAERSIGLYGEAARSGFFSSRSGTVTTGPRRRSKGRALPQSWPTKDI